MYAGYVPIARMYTFVSGARYAGVHVAGMRLHHDSIRRNSMDENLSSKDSNKNYNAAIGT